jgi:guanylate kinase
MLQRNNTNGKIIIISAPSGAGKSSIINKLLEYPINNLKYSVSYTTRSQRWNEKEGENYFFVNTKMFHQMIKNKIFIEWALVHNTYYGTSKKLLEDMLYIKKQNIILELDVQGAMKIKQLYTNICICMIFIMTPKFNDLRNRLLSRYKDKKYTNIIEERLNTAKKELEFVNRYDYLVINHYNQLTNAVYAIKSIIESLNYKIIK